MERKLTAILAADVVGYSALMERDEAGAFDRLKVTEQIRRLECGGCPACETIEIRIRRSLDVSSSGSKSCS